MDLERTRNEVLPVLELCYKHMPIYLRRCFISLSLYPKGHLSNKREIIHLWKSLDLLNSNGSADEKETGSLYLKELVQRSILQMNDSLDWFKMHDLFHDLACFLSEGEFYRLEGDALVEIPQNVRCNVRELRNVNKLKELWISGLGGISCIEDAHEAQLQSKKQLRSLYLDFVDTPCQHIRSKYASLSDDQPLEIWQRHRSRTELTGHILQSEHITLSHDQLLESLRPHCSITKLTIVGYKSHKYPSWLGIDSFSKLTKVSLWNCESKHLPALGRLPSLEYINIDYMPNVERVGREFTGHPSKGFPSLTNIEFHHMSNWLEWYGVDDGDFVHLQTLSITGGLKLKSIPMAPFLSLLSVHLDRCHITTIPACSHTTITSGFAPKSLFVSAL
ncbi:hypothetical protein EJB05_34728, partial [Eragrostis curvula]